MSEQEKKIMDAFEQVLPKLSESERERLLAFGEGMAFKAGATEPATRAGE